MQELRENTSVCSTWVLWVVSSLKRWQKIQTLHCQDLQQTAFHFLFLSNLSPLAPAVRGVIPFPTIGRPQWKCVIFQRSLGVSDLAFTNIWIYLHTFVCLGFFNFIFVMNGFCIKDLSAMGSFLLWNFSKSQMSCLYLCNFRNHA